MNKKFLVQALVVLACLFMLSTSTAFSQDPCQSYHDKYRICVEKNDVGSHLDIYDCYFAGYTDVTSNGVKYYIQ